jgi:hypothetical protein
MGRRRLAHEIKNYAKARRAGALERMEFRSDSVQREAPAGATSFPLKKEDPELRAMIDAALAKRRQS